MRRGNVTNDAAMLTHGERVSLRAELVQELRRALHIREEEGDGAGREIASQSRDHPPGTIPRLAPRRPTRLLAFFAGHGISAKRLLTDNAFTYVNNRSLRDLLIRREIRHLTTQPYRPRTNGKVERFHQTMAREWAYGLRYHSHQQRNKALPHWLHHYNHRRPHSAIGDRPPISRVHNLRG